MGSRRTKPDLPRLPLILNIILIGIGIFTIIAMSVVIGVFEEFTAFTDYTQQWIEFNFFLFYWDKLTITRVYLSFIYIYGGVLIAVAAFQIHGMRKRNIDVLYLAPLILVSVAVITVLGAIAWLITTSVNHNEGFLATGGFIFERMRFKGNVWKDLKFREQSWIVVTENDVPRKAPILRTWVHQRERDFDCCGWNSYMDYAKGNYTDLPESCCKRKYRVFKCGANWLNEDKTNILNTRGCGPLMYDWYRSGFGMNIAMAIIGLGIAALQFYTYTVNRREYFTLLYELDDMARPMMNGMSLSTINSKSSAIVSGIYATAGPPQGARSTPSPRNVLPKLVNSSQASNYSYNNMQRPKLPGYEQTPSGFVRKQ